MKYPRSFVTRTLALHALLLLVAFPLSSLANGPISYQGRLVDDGEPANGVYDFEFGLYGSPLGGSVIGSPIAVEDVTVSEGLFSTELNFDPDTFDGTEYYLQIGVRPGDSGGAYTDLTGRIPLTKVPYAEYAFNAATLDGSAPADFAPTLHDHSSLSAPDGSPADVVAIENDGTVQITNPVDLGPLVIDTQGERLIVQGASGALSTFFTSYSIDLVPDSPARTMGIQGASAPAGTPANGGTVYISGGDGPFDSPGGGGEVSIAGGYGSSTAGGDGGPVSLYGGGGSGESTGNGGGVTIQGGEGGGDISGTGGHGGWVHVQGGGARGTGDNSGGSIVLAPGSGTGAGNDGSVLISSGVSINSASAPVQELYVNGSAWISGAYYDSSSTPGTAGQVLSSTGTETNWIDLPTAVTPSHLDSPDGMTSPVVAAQDDGSTTFAGPLRMSAGSPNLVTQWNHITASMPTYGMTLRETSGQLQLIPEGNPNEFIVAPETPLASGDASRVQLSGGSATSDGTGGGGDLELFGGEGAGLSSGDGGTGGDVLIQGGDAHGTGHNGGGDVILRPGSRTNAGQPGRVTIEGLVETTGEIRPATDMASKLGTSTRRFSELHLGPGSLNLHSTVGETPSTARDWSLGIESTGNLALKEGSNTALTVKPDGKIGIGNTDPFHSLVVQSADSETMRLMGPGTLGSSAKLNFGDVDWTYIEEDTDDHLHIQASDGLKVQAITVTGNIHLQAVPLPSSSYPLNHAVLIDNPNDVANSADGLAIRLSAMSNPTSDNNYISFVDGDDDSVGAIEGNGAGSVVLSAAGADYAEFLPKLNPAEELLPGDVVGVRNGQITRNTSNADRVMVISSNPIVQGNDPGDDQRHAYGLAAFVGQARVRITGTAQPGDMLIPSGLNDGTARAVSSDDITLAQLNTVIGRVIQTEESNTAVAMVGLPQSAIVTFSLTRELMERDRQINDLQRRLERIEAAMQQQLASAAE